eukprot:COSAG05_NODE_1519_length_4648_cov_43.348648_4_plen_193_part_00
MAMEEVQTRVTDVTSGTIDTISNQLTGAIKELIEADNQKGVEKLAERIEMAWPRVAHVRGQVRGRLRHEICARMLARDYAAGEYINAQQSDDDETRNQQLQAIGEPPAPVLRQELDKVSAACRKHEEKLERRRRLREQIAAAAAAGPNSDSDGDDFVPVVPKPRSRPAEEEKKKQQFMTVAKKCKGAFPYNR